MIANAGIAPAAPFFESTSPTPSFPTANIGLTCYLPLMPTATTEQLDAVTSVNIRGTFLCYKYAALQMVKQGRGGRLIGSLDFNFLIHK